MHITDFMCVLSCRMELIKEFEVPTQVNSASLHPEKSVFVCGGEDFKMYKFNYSDGEEIGKYISNDFYS